MNNNMEENILFTNYISGIKGIPLDTEILLVNDIPNNSLNFVYNINGNQMFIFPKPAIKNITFKTRVRMQTTKKEVEETQTKSILLSAALFGGAPILQVAGGQGLNALFKGLSNNYEKVDYNAYYEITIEINHNNQDFRIVLSSETTPEIFIQKILPKPE